MTRVNKGLSQDFFAKLKYTAYPTAGEGSILPVRQLGKAKVLE